MYPSEFKYTKDHEWVRLEGSEAVVGVTDYAQQQLGDVVFVELPEIGRHLAQGDVFGTIESVKAVSELFSPLGGEVVAVNGDLAGAPESVNTKPHETWLIRVRVTNEAETASLLSSADYEALVS